MRVLVDADLVLEALLNRERWLEPAEKLWEMIESRQVQGHITKIGLDKISAYVSQLKNPKIAEEVTFEIQDIFQICPVNRSILETAWSSDLIDFESAVEVACAVEGELGAIVTQNLENFAKATLPILSVKSLLEAQHLAEIGCGHKWLVGTEQGEQGEIVQTDSLAVTLSSPTPPASQSANPAYLYQQVFTTPLKQWCATESQQVPEPPSADTATFLAAPKSIFPSVPSLSEVFDFIEANYYRGITLRDVAQAVGYSPAYLTNLVGSQTGKTVNRWIVERRMAAACSLLRDTGQSVYQIAQAVGYLSVDHFFRQFRQHYGMTPQEWRNKYRSYLTT